MVRLHSGLGGGCGISYWPRDAGCDLAGVGHTGAVLVVSYTSPIVMMAVRVVFLNCLGGLGGVSTLHAAERVLSLALAQEVEVSVTA